MVGHEPLIMTSASGALLNQDQQVLLQARADTGDWGFPGGYMEYGESFSDTVKREFKEDAGFEIQTQKDGSFIVGNVFVPHDQISQCLADNKHELNHVSVVTKMDLKENADIAGI